MVLCQCIRRWSWGIAALDLFFCCHRQECDDSASCMPASQKKERLFPAIGEPVGASPDADRFLRAVVSIPNMKLDRDVLDGKVTR